MMFSIAFCKPLLLHLHRNILSQCPWIGISESRRTCSTSEAVRSCPSPREAERQRLPHHVSPRSRLATNSPCSSRKTALKIAGHAAATCTIFRGGRLRVCDILDLADLEQEMHDRPGSWITACRFLHVGNRRQKKAAPGGLRRAVMIRRPLRVACLKGFRELRA